MREINRLAWRRLNIIAAINGDVVGRTILGIFYFTILMPFGLASSLLSDPLRKKSPRAEWLERPPVPNDLQSAREQG